jgi:hypothetical protein
MVECLKTRPEEPMSWMWVLSQSVSYQHQIHTKCQQLIYFKKKTVKFILVHVSTFVAKLWLLIICRMKYFLKQNAGLATSDCAVANAPDQATFIAISHDDATMQQVGTSWLPVNPKP